MRRVACLLEGVVQGVGFRPFVYRMAKECGLSGFVRNEGRGVRVEIEGEETVVDTLLGVLRKQAPVGARIESLQICELPLQGTCGFVIADSVKTQATQMSLAADSATCAACRAELLTPGQRRYRYPFTSCNSCGPRYSIVEALPYDRGRSAMRAFPLCAACADEYENPRDRRFHAQANACPSCGPSLCLLDACGAPVAVAEQALQGAVRGLLAGQIVAVKGLGGFHLMVDATNAAAVADLRRRKGRAAKPFAVMFQSLAAVRGQCAVASEEARELESSLAPIVLLRCRDAGSAHAPVVADVAPGNPWLGVMLPYTPVHHLVLREVGRPLVCTSANVSEEPLCITNEEAVSRLAGIADGFLVHDRDIRRPLDDSVVRVLPGGVQVLRRARGLVPFSLRLPVASDHPNVLALGGHLKNTIALVSAGRVAVSQHVGDLSSLAARAQLRRAVEDVLGLCGTRVQRIACDLHPDYASSLLADELALRWQVPVARIQHHHAHVAACMAEYGLCGPVLGVVWDGAGLGTDGSVWGGEALIVDAGGFRRVAHLRPFPLVGGDKALAEPRRAALGMLFELYGKQAESQVEAMFPDGEANVLVQLLEGSVRTVRTTSMGRLFDSVAALTGVRAEAGFEGQAAMALEMVAEGGDPSPAGYSLPLRLGSPAQIDWEPLLCALLEDRRRGVAAGVMAARFHVSLAEVTLKIAEYVGLEQVVLSGGCFQNRRLLLGAQSLLVARGFRVYVGMQYPVNDGGLSLGQAFVATHVHGENC